ncbi:MAG: methyltransferase domain-containing protein [Candidatus Hydrogenedentes bacterium]|nr:methyltransferase domain-containing protein [Candidatus Hydrogenedentota bacterium]
MGKAAHADVFRFLKAFIESPIRTGAIAASSRELADIVSEMGGVREAKLVVEFGPGTGAITELILEKLARDATFFAMEINPEFVQAVRKRFPHLRVYHDSAVNTPKYLNELGFPCCDSVVSGLPWSSFSNQLQDDLLDATVAALRPGGKFATYMYLQSKLIPNGSKFRSKLEARFSRVATSRVVWKNLPPAFVYQAIK